MNKTDIYTIIRMARLSAALDSFLPEDSTIIWLPNEEDESEQPKKKPKKEPTPLVPGFIGGSLAA